MRFKLFTIILIWSYFLSSCDWLDKRALKNWTNSTIDHLVEMSSRKSMIKDTPYKTIEGIEDLKRLKKNLSKKNKCLCTVDFYGNLMSVVSNNLSRKNVEIICNNMRACFFNGEFEQEFNELCYQKISNGSLRSLIKKKSESLKSLTRARRNLRTYCGKI